MKSVRVSVRPLAEEKEAKGEVLKSGGGTVGCVAVGPKRLFWAMWKFTFAGNLGNGWAGFL